MASLMDDIDALNADDQGDGNGDGRANVDASAPPSCAAAGLADVVRRAHLLGGGADAAPIRPSPTPPNRLELVHHVRRLGGGVYAAPVSSIADGGMGAGAVDPLTINPPPIALWPRLTAPDMHAPSPSRLLYVPYSSATSSSSSASKTSSSYSSHNEMDECDPSELMRIKHEYAAALSATASTPSSSSFNSSSLSFGGGGRWSSLSPPGAAALPVPVPSASPAVRTPASALRTPAPVASRSSSSSLLSSSSSSSPAVQSWSAHRERADRKAATEYAQRENEWDAERSESARQIAAAELELERSRAQPLAIRPEVLLDRSVYVATALPPPPPPPPPALPVVSSSAASPSSSSSEPKRPVSSMPAHVDAIVIDDSDDDEPAAVTAPIPTSSSVSSVSSSSSSSSDGLDMLLAKLEFETLSDFVKRQNELVALAVKQSIERSQASSAVSDSASAAAAALAMKKRPLTAEENSIVDAVFATRGSRLIAEGFNMEIQGEHMQCLRPGQWLNDEVMNFFFELLRERFERNATAASSSSSSSAPSASAPLKCHFFNTHFYAQLAKTSDGFAYKKVQRWTRRLKATLLTMDFVFVPIHVGQSHWCLAVIDVRAKLISYWDSLSGGDHGCLEHLLRYFTEEAKDKAPLMPFDASEWRLEVVKNVPRQRNGFDCGVFTCKMADYLAEGRSPLAFGQDDMPYFRRRLALEIKIKRVD